MRSPSLSRPSRIRHRNGLTVKAWEKAVKELGKNFSSCVQRDISRVSVINTKQDIELNTRRERIPYFQATMYYFVYYIKTKAPKILKYIICLQIKFSATMKPLILIFP